CADVRYLGSWPTGPAAGAQPPLVDELESAVRFREALC
ncbi:prephenate dehydratase, partial [Mycobacterium tuberculosis]|nr:prephenate dehydratase [Mycobacterium tuberculosis]